MLPCWGRNEFGSQPGTSCLKTSLASLERVISGSWGAFPDRERTVRPESKDSIFNRIAASEGASHSPETRVSSATSSPPLWLHGSSVSFLNDPRTADNCALLSLPCSLFLPRPSSSGHRRLAPSAIKTQFGCSSCGDHHWPSVGEYPASGG